MTKTSRSLLPEQHKQTNNLKGVYDKLRNSVPEGSTDNRQIVEAVHRILERYRTCEESTQDRRDAKLVNFIMDEFQALLKPYIDNYSKTVGLEDIIEEVLEGDDVQEGIVAEIKKVVKTSIKKLQVKTQVESTTVTQVIDQKDREKQFAKNLDDIFDDIKNSKNPELTKYKKLVQNTDEKHTQSIVDLYKKSCKKLFDKISKSKNKDLKTRKQTKKVGVGQKTIKEKRPKNLVENTISGGTADLVGKIEIQEIKKRQKNILAKKFKPYKVIEKKKNYFSFINEAFKRLKKRISRIFSPILDKIKKIGGAILGPLVLVMRWTILPLAKTVLKIGGALFKGIGLLGKGMIKALKFFRVDKLIKGVYHVFLDIGKMVGTAVKNTFLAFVMTPAGAYTVGFILGFLWTKITNRFKGGGFMDTIRNMKDAAVDFIKPTFRAFSNLFFGIFDNYIKPVIDFFAPIVKPAVSAVRGILEWILGHKALVATILTLCPVIEQILSLSMLCKKAFRIAGSPLAGLIAAGIIAVYYGIQGIFKWRKDEDFRLAKGKSKLYSEFTGANEIAIKGLSQEDQKNYGDLTQKIGIEKNDLDQLIRDIDSLKEEYEEDESTTLDLSKTYPEFVESVFYSDLFGNDKKELQKFKQFSNRKRVVDQLKELIRYVNKRYDKLIVIQSGFSSTKTSAELKNLLSRVADFSGDRITISQNVDEVASLIKHDDFDGNGKELFKPLTWFNDPEAAKRKAQHFGDKLAGKKFTYKVDGQYVSMGPGPGAYIPAHEVSEREYLNNSTNRSYHKVEVGTQQDRSKEVEELLKGFSGTDTDRRILKNYLLSNSGDIDKLKESNSEGRNKALRDVLTKWQEQNEKTEEQRQKEEEERVRKQIEKIELDTQDYVSRNKQLEEDIEKLTKGVA